ncbi:hypothetical protein B0H63DRAFT_182370 [Podospora didyma]|uniref:Uncharacterized protein n=1 Tax=Podospora didyma TaxID=330526 RepID=A0AAE0NPS9_9PEZI|nr:hypothetical protein B0H63DRAFT_182370 [Podospora didyma]
MPPKKPAKPAGAPSPIGEYSVEFEEDEEEDDESAYEQVAASSKRKAATTTTTGRPRGRPPKVAKVAPTASGRPRSRPRKTPAVEEEEAVKAVPSSTGRLRGRPPKSAPVAVASEPPRSRGRPPKNPKPAPAAATKPSKAAPVPKTYFVRMKCRDTGTGEIHSTAEKGTIKFKKGSGKASFASFVGEVDMPGIGSRVGFTAHKVSDAPGVGGDSWDEYSAQASEQARVGRWR